VLFEIVNGLPRDTAKAALSKIRALSPTDAAPIVSAPNSSGVYWVQIDDPRHEALFRGFLAQSRVTANEHTALPNGGTLQPVKPFTRPLSPDEARRLMDFLLPGVRGV
jgi:hypothetical protein